MYPMARPPRKIETAPSLVFQKVFLPFLVLVLADTAPRILASNVNVTQAEVAALLDFKSLILDDPRHRLTTWNVTLQSNLCQWRHVNCTGSRVSHLNLGGLDLIGTISGRLGDLHHLLSLDLSENLFVGSIPFELARCTSLKTLNLGSCNLQGIIPPQLGNLTSLTSLDLSGQNLSGPIPAQLGNLTSLTYLDLSRQNLSGPIPAQLGNLTSLTYLDLSRQNLSGPIPAQLGNLTSLTFLDLSGQILSGPIPAHLGDLGNLTELYLQENALTGAIPRHLGRLTNLQTLQLDKNMLSGPIPVQLSNIGNLSTFTASCNQLTGTIPPQFGQLNNLTTLGLSCNNLQGPFPPELSTMGDASGMNTMLEFAYNNLSGPIPPLTSLPPTLYKLDLAGNQFTGTFPSQYTSLESLSLLYLGSNQLTGTLPPDLVFCTNPNNCNQFTLNVSDNHLTGPLPPSLFDHNNLFHFSVAHNDFSGPLPPNLNNSTTLIVVELQGNQLSGPLPPLTNLTGLGSFLAQNNRFNHSIPPDFLDWAATGTGTGTWNLNLANNSLTGGIPAGIGAPYLGQLVLANNSLTGGVPPSLQLSAPRMTLLDLSGNNLNGSLDFSRSPSNLTLQTLVLGNNNFTGNLPPGLVSFRGLRQLDISNCHLSGPIPSDPRAWTSPLLTSLVLANNSLTAGIPPQLGQLSGLKTLNLEGNQLEGPIPPQLQTLSSITDLDLRSNLLSFPIPTNLSVLRNLTRLDLSQNGLNGTLPPEMAGLSHLTAFNVSSNFLEGSLPAGNLSSFPAASYLNNSALCGNPLPGCPTQLAGGAIAGIVIGAAIGCAIIFLLALFVYKWLSMVGPDGGKMEVYVPLPVRLTYNEILRATSNWGEEKLLGKGGFGSVYKAPLRDGKTVLAVKRLEANSSQGLGELRAEVGTLGRLRHRNLVKLIGLYTSTTESLLIYELLTGGDLDGFLYGSPDERFNEWQTRLNILLGSARGFKYLHHDCSPAVIHRDIKPPNILIDGELEPRVADFGLAKEINTDMVTHLSTSVSGTVGYLAPEYASGGKLTTKSDVFAFGVVILEVMTGRRPTDRNIGDMGLARWVNALWMKADAMAAVDPKLVVVGDRVFEVLGCLKLGLMCTSTNPKQRPSMADVVHLMENLGLFATINQVDTGSKRSSFGGATSSGRYSVPTGSEGGSVPVSEQFIALVEGRD